MVSPVHSLAETVLSERTVWFGLFLLPCTHFLWSGSKHEVIVVRRLVVADVASFKHQPAAHSSSPLNFQLFKIILHVTLKPLSQKL